MDQLIYVLAACILLLIVLVGRSAGRRSSLKALSAYAKKNELKVIALPDEEMWREIDSRGRLRSLGSTVRNIVQTPVNVRLMDCVGGRWRPGDAVTAVRANFTGRHLIVPIMHPQATASSNKFAESLISTRYPSLQRAYAGAEVFRNRFVLYSNSVESCRGFVYRAEKLLLASLARWPASLSKTPVVFEVDDGVLFIYTSRILSVGDAEFLVALGSALKSCAV